MYKAERKKMQKRDNRSQALHTTHNSMVFFFFLKNDLLPIQWIKFKNQFILD